MCVKIQRQLKSKIIQTLPDCGSDYSPPTMSAAKFRRASISAGYKNFLPGKAGADWAQGKFLRNDSDLIPGFIREFF